VMKRRMGSIREFEAILAIVMAAASPARGQVEAAKLVLDHAPIFRFEPGGPTNQVTGLAFGADGRTLFVAGYDKVVQVWTLDPASGKFGLDRRATLRVPIGPGLDGAINALAISADGAWLATAGRGPIRGSAGFRQPGEVVGLDAFPKESRLDLGRIAVFSTRGGAEPRSFEGHEGAVRALAFSTMTGRPPVLASAALEGTQVVVRAWDVIDGRPLGVTPGFTPGPSNTMPSMAVRRIGDGKPSGFEVALVWGDRPLRTWQFSAAGVREWPSQAESLFVAVAGGPDPSRLIASSFDFRKGRGELTTWARAEAGQHRSGLLFEFPVGGRGRANVLPEALTLVAVPPSKVPDHAAVVLRTETPGSPMLRYGLQLVPLDPAHPRAPGPVDLGEAPIANHPSPIVAADPSGTHLAVAYRPDREVELLAVADVLKGLGTPRQALQSPALTFRQAVFARRGPTGEDWGLLLDPTSKVRPGEPLRQAGPGAVVFDLKAGTLSTSLEGWAIPPPPSGGLPILGRLGDAVTQGPALFLKRPGLPDLTFPLKPGDEVTDFALSPPPAGDTRSLAVGLRRFPDGPMLILFDARTGAKIGELSGHTDVIRGLSFSGDGRWLLSASDDRSVSAWDVAELVGASDRTIKGVRLTQADAGLVVLTVDPGSQPFLDDLRPGDVITSIFRGGKWDTLGSPRRLADAIFETRPGEKVVVGRARGPSTKAVTLEAARAVAERKPALSLSLTRDGGEGRQPHWLAWTPLGSYDLSDPSVEGLLGWHFNPATPGPGVRFANSGDYRDRRSPGLVRRRFLGDPPPRRSIPIRAELRVVPDPRDLGGPAPPRHHPKNLRLRLADPLPPAGAVASVSVRLDGGPPNPMTPAEGQAWATELVGLAPRTWHSAEVTLRTDEPAPQVVSFVERFRFVPELPSIEVDPVAERVESERFVVSAKLGGPGDARRLLVRAWHLADAPPEFEAVEAGTYRKEVKLRPGTNEIEIEARPEGLPPEEAGAETSRTTLRVSLAKAQTPTITLEDEAREGGPSALHPRAGRPLAFEVREPKTRVVGVIRCKAARLSEATIEDGEGPPRPLAGFVAGTSNEFRFGESIDLSKELGTRIVRLKARSQESDPAELSLTVRYRPLAATIERITLEPRGTDVFDGADGSPPKVQLSALFRSEPGSPPSRPSVLLNDAEVTPVSLDEAGRRVSASIIPRPGRNELRVRLRNDWDVETLSAPIVVTYKRLPRVTAVSRSRSEGRPFIDLTAEVASPDALEPTACRLQRERPGQGGPVEVEEVPVETPIRRQGPGRFILTARNVPLKAGRNRFVVWAFNPDGRSIDPGRSEVIEYEEPPTHRLLAEIIRPDRDLTLAVPTCPVEFRARTTDRLREVKLIRADESGRTEVVYPIPGQSFEPGGSAMEGRVEARLVKGLNTFTLTAVDQQDLPARDLVTIAYDPPPLTATVDALVVDGKVVRPGPTDGGKLGFPGLLSNSWVTLRGTVRWPDDRARQASPEVTVTVLVNGTPWWRKRVTAGDALARPFETGLRLPTPRSLLTVQVTGSAVDEKAAVEHVVACRPETLRRWLRLLVVGVRAGDGPEKLRSEALGAFRGRLKAEQQGEFDTPVFEKGVLYGPLSGDDAERSQIYGQLDLIRDGLTGLDEDVFEAAAEVIVIYYRGDEHRSSTSRALRLGGRGQEIGLDEIHRQFAGKRGCQVYLLDVARDPGPVDAPDFPESLASDPGEARPVRLRVSWLRPEGDPSTADRLLGVLRGALPSPSTIEQLDETLRGHYRGRRADLDYEHLVDPPQRGTILVDPGGSR
jgi:WD domain, G-beta repeat